MPQLKELLGRRIKEVRKARGLTQEQLSELTGIGAASISKIENGFFHPTDDNLEKIAAALKIEPYKLYMCAHNRNISELKKDIISMIRKADDDKVRLAYNILNSMLI